MYQSIVKSVAQKVLKTLHCPQFWEYIQWLALYNAVYSHLQDLPNSAVHDIHMNDNSWRWLEDSAQSNGQEGDMFYAVS